MKRSEIFFSALLIPIDFVALVGAFTVSYYLRDAHAFLSPEGLTSLASRLKYDPLSQVVLSFDHYLRYLSVIIPVMLLIFAFVGLYTIRSSTPWFKRLSQIFIGVSMGEFFILILFLLKKDFFLPRSTVLYSWVLGTLFVIAGRVLIGLIRRLLHQFGRDIIRIGVVGKNTIASRVLKQLKTNPSSQYRVTQFDSVILEDLESKITRRDIDELIVICEQYTDQELVSLRNFCLAEHVTFSFVPSLLTELQSTFDVRTFKDIPMIEVRPTPLEGWGRVFKRIFDILGSLFFIVLFSPFFVVIAIWIKLASPGPLIYKHRRIGRNKRPIDIWKFRSLRWEYCTGVGGPGDALFAEKLKENPELAAEWKETHKLKNDFRISAPGRFIRKTSLDELPQFFNSLFGDLSLVGPRPIVEEEIEKFGEKADLLFAVKPGITGPWQVQGRNEISYDERVLLNTEYIEHWNIFTDIMILLKTAKVLVVKGDKGGAY